MSPFNAIKCGRGILSAVAMATLGFGAMSALAGEPATRPANVEDLQAQVDQLKAQVQSLTADQQQKQADLTAAINDVMKDAQNHSTVLDDAAGFTSGWSTNRFVLQSDDGKFVLRPWINLQIRDATTYRHDGKGGDNDDIQNGLEIHRARIGFDGNIFGPELTYDIDVASNSDNSVPGSPVLEEAWVKNHFDDTDFYIRAGQIHDPLSHEAIIGANCRGAESSLSGDVFANTDTFTQAATVIYDPQDAFRIEGGITNGIRAANTDFQEPLGSARMYRWGMAARGEYKVMGDWNDYNQLTSLNDQNDLLVIGVGADYSEGAAGFNSLTFTPDVQYASPGGWMGYASYFGRYTSHNPGIPMGGAVSTVFGTPENAGQDTYEWSVLGEVAYLVDEQWEPYLRYEHLALKGTPEFSQNNVDELSLGVNYYLHGHNAKITVQGMYLPEGFPVTDLSNDVLISTDKAEFIFIAQFQLLL